MTILKITIQVKLQKTKFKSGWITMLEIIVEISYNKQNNKICIDKTILEIIIEVKLHQFNDLDE